VWAEILRDAGAEGDVSIRLPSSDVSDEVAFRLMESTSRVLGVSPQQVADAFGEHWCCTYAPKLYGNIMRRFKNAREMILGLDKLHVEMTRTIPNARPPRFEYRWATPNLLVVDYISQRNMVHVYCGLVRGVGKYYKESLQVQNTGNKVEIRFAAA
jgi:hypothetical protein